MNKKAVGFIVIAVVVIIIIALVSGSDKKVEQVSNQPIKIGAALSLSGAAVQDGESIKNGIELAKADLEKAGVKTEVVYQDDQTEGKGTVSAIRALSVQGVQAIIGPTWSFLGDAGVPVADQLKLVAVMPANTSEYVLAKSPYAFFTTTRVSQMVPTLAKWLKDNKIKSIAMLSNDGAWYLTVSAALTEAATQAGAKIIFKENIIYGQETTALPTLLTKMKATNADLYFTEIDSDDGVAVMFKKMRELQMKGSVMSVSTSLGRVLNSDPKGFGLTNHVYVLAPKTSPEFDAKYKSAYGKLPSAYADTAYDSYMLLVDALQNKGSMPLADYLRDKTNYKGMAHQYDFDANGDVVGGEWVVNTLK